MAGARLVSSLSLGDQVVVVTGASSGIGAHLVQVFHEAGASVALVARRAERLAEVADGLERAQPLPPISPSRLSERT